MRTYGGRLINSFTRKILAGGQELRDAIVWDVDATNKYCRVKIQGSDTLIRAYYNNNWECTPQWLKPGNSVRISQPGGNKGRIEVIGHGILLPTAIPGGTASPTATTPGDTIIEGLGCYATDPAGMAVDIAPGSYRLDGLVYELGAIEMPRTDLEMPLENMTMGGSAGAVYFDAASAYYFRYDIIVAGTDGIAHVVKGTNVTGEPTMPALPADHILINWVLIYPGMTTITQADIGRKYLASRVSELRVEIEDAELELTDLTTYITISMRDQYGNVVFYPGYFVTIEFTAGNGTLSHGGSSSTSSLTVNFTGTTSITYTRDGNDPGDGSPFFTITESYSKLSTGCFIKVLNALGNAMYTGLA